MNRASEIINSTLLRKREKAKEGYGGRKRTVYII